MYKLVSTALLLVSFSSQVNAQEIKQGILQAYWLPVWNDDGTQSTPHLKYRYIASVNGEKADKVINIESNDSELTLQNISHYFDKVPPNFVEFKEGHIERAGTISVAKMKGSTECSHHYYEAELVAFTPLKDKTFNIDKLEKSAGCESYPYAVTYTLKEQAKDTHFKASPEDSAKDTGAIPMDSPLIKVKTVNAQWIQAAVYDESKPGLIGTPGGYVKMSYLQPVN
ncbi:hypothetical protein BN137_2489 [Cronobacter condimenti 1330]|uniref:Uncharacterized protein n=1 Tax=Cronobacter condimenti 1330 TaxID=1073999 RepID=K8A124_9ENTR|nr:hypothetical protein [Cronobacter condimenti]ALB61086.1 hypothetical protein AFK62_00440 [Cronobacter condimenti 1330]CCJ73118.1 hypothetical protein BN137_2489 [Cronobacter condimenti 1330]